MAHVSVLILGARRGGTHVFRVMRRLGVSIEGIYDQSSKLPLLARARRAGVPTYAGSWCRLPEMLSACKGSSQGFYYVYLPSRDPRFRRFVHQQMARMIRAGVANTKLLEMDVHFGERASARALVAAWRPEHRALIDNGGWLRRLRAWPRRTWPRAQRV